MILNDYASFWICVGIVSSLSFPVPHPPPLSLNRDAPSSSPPLCFATPRAVPCSDILCDIRLPILVFSQGSEVELSLSSSPFQPTGCQKMQICPALNIQQKQKVTFHVRDNLLRDSANFTIQIRDPVVRTISGKYMGDSSYTVSLESNRTGTHLLQYFVGGVEAPDSPFLVKV